ncbi:hypothetical protein Neosp_009154 [[Neocosmospora] mangrovei]
MIEVIQTLLEFQDEGPVNLSVMDWLMALYGFRYAISGDIEDLETAIELGEKTAAYLMDDSENPEPLLNLGVLLGQRYNISKYMPDLEACTSFLNRFVSAKDKKDVSWAIGTCYLGIALFINHTKTKAKEDLEAAISAVRQGMDAIPTSLSTYYEHMAMHLFRMLRELPTEDEDGEAENEGEDTGASILEEVAKEVAKKVPFLQDKLERIFRNADLLAGEDVFRVPSPEEYGKVESTRDPQERFVLETRGDPLGPKNQTQIRLGRSGASRLVAVSLKGRPMTVDSYSIRNTEDIERIIYAYGEKRHDHEAEADVDREFVELEGAWREVVDNDFSIGFF